MKVRYALFVAAAAMLVFAPAAILGAKEKVAPKLSSVSAELAKVEAGSIAVVVKKGENRDTVTRAIAVDGDTRILIETDQMESVPGEGGKTRERPKVVEGTLDDLKAMIGRKVVVGCTEDGLKALKILVPRIAQPKKDSGREGDAPRAPKTPKTGGEGDRKVK